jgi:hypothetical protein
MRDAIIDFLLEERAAESFQTSPALTVDPSTVSWTSASSGAMSSFFNSPDNYAIPTPASLEQSPLPEAPIGDYSAFTPGPVDRSPQSLDAMTGVFSVSTGAQPKQRTRRKMTEAEKVDYRNRRIAKACDKCAKRKRKCQHGENANAAIAAPASSCNRVVKSPQAGVKRANTASIQFLPSALPDQTSLFRLGDIGPADLLDISMLGDLDVKPEDFMFDAFVHDSQFANFGDQNFQAVTNSASPTLRDSAPRRPCASSIIVEDFELYSPPGDSEDGWATSTNPTTLNFASLNGGQQSTAHSSRSHIPQQHLGQAAQSGLTLQSTNDATGADTTALFNAHQPQNALAQLTRARECPRLGNNLLQSAATIDNSIVAMSNIGQQTIVPNIPHDAEGYCNFATDHNANSIGIFATCKAHGIPIPSGMSPTRPDSTIDSNSAIHQAATQASIAMLASTMFADDGQGPLSFQNAASRLLSPVAGLYTYADLQQHVVRDQSRQTSAGQNVGAHGLVHPESRRSHAVTTDVLTGSDVAAFMFTTSYGDVSQPSYLQLGGRGIRHAEPFSRAASIPAILAPSSSGTQDQQDDGHQSAADLCISRHDLTNRFALANICGKSLINMNVAGAQLPARSQQIKDEPSAFALLSPQGLSMASCLLVILAFLLMPLGVDNIAISFLMFALLVTYGRGWDNLSTQQNGLALVDDKSSTRGSLSRSLTWAVPNVVLRSQLQMTLRSLSKATSAQMSLLTRATAGLRIESTT